MKTAQEKKNKIRQNRKFRVRKKLRGEANKPRLSVFRSSTQVYAQLIDDVQGVTLASASSLDKSLKDQVVGKGRKEKAEIVGAHIAKKAKEISVESVRFDRGPYKYHGIVAALANSARKEGLKI